MKILSDNITITTECERRYLTERGKCMTEKEEVEQKRLKLEINVR